jgi:NADPH-dependent 2,4-dienoyl-CoA reductase/sulfur reductase-like enzyme
VLGAPLAPGAAAQEPAAIGFEVTVVYVSPQPGPVDARPRAQELDRLLRPRIRYESLRLIESGRRDVALNDIGSVELPTGQRFRFRPLDSGEKGVLVAVDMDQTAQGDFRIPKGKPLVLGGQPYQDGQLFVVLQATP